jgi:dihydropteroate synthase
MLDMRTAQQRAGKAGGAMQDAREGVPEAAGPVRPAALLPWGQRTYVVGIVNCSPDSFAGDGLPDAAAAVAHGLRLVHEGADVLDVGGASTRPGAAPVDAEEERRRVLPVVEALAGRVARPLSVDTTTAAVAAAALRAGAAVVNDVSALGADPDMAHVVREHGATVVLMDNRLAPAGAPPGWHAPRVPPTADVVPAVGAWLARRVAAAEAAGIERGRLVLDPGLGFGKTPAQSLALVRRLARLRRYPGLAGLPLLVGPSRTGFIGHVLGLPVGERLEGTLAVLALCVVAGADAVRVHDVRAAVRCCRMADAVVREAAGP